MNQPPGANRSRFFAELVSVDAWHKPFDEGRRVADLHADVVFRIARMSDPTSTLSFRLGLKRAEIRVVIPPFEPIEIIKSSVARDDPSVGGRMQLALTQASKSSDALNASVGIGNGIATRLTGSRSKERSTRQQVSVDRPSTGMKVLQSKSADGEYRWEVSPLLGNLLEGRGWDAKTQPRLQLRDKSNMETIPPVVRVVVTCAKEDIVIEDIRYKDETFGEKIVTRVFHDNRRVAAESYIRSRMAEYGLDFGTLVDPFANICLADVTAGVE